MILPTGIGWRCKAIAIALQAVLFREREWNQLTKLTNQRHLSLKLRNKNSNLYAEVEIVFSTISLLSGYSGRIWAVVNLESCIVAKCIRYCCSGSVARTVVEIQLSSVSCLTKPLIVIPKRFHELHDLSIQPEYCGIQPWASVSIHSTLWEVCLSIVICFVVVFANEMISEEMISNFKGCHVCIRIFINYAWIFCAGLDAWCWCRWGGANYDRVASGCAERIGTQPECPFRARLFWQSSGNHCQSYGTPLGMINASLCDCLCYGYHI